MKGSEDLGAGTSAIFKLENGLDVNTVKLGQGGLEFGRQAYVGLSNDKYGSLTFGRQYDSLVLFFAPVTANGNWGGYIFEHPFDNDNTEKFFRLNNAVQYNSPDIAGFKFGATYAFSNNAGQFSTNNAQSVGMWYANGGLSVGAAYLNINKPGANALGAVTTSDAGFPASQQQVYGIGVNYQLGKALFGVAYSHTDLRDPTSYAYISGPIIPAGQTAPHLKFDNFEVQATYSPTPAWMVGAMYDYTQAKLDASNGTFNPKWHTVGLMTDYNLSKRTDVYLQAAYQRAGDGNSGTALDKAYVGGAYDSSSNSQQIIARVGIRHKF